MKQKSAVIRNGIVENIVSGNYIGVSLCYKDDPDVIVVPCTRYNILRGDFFKEGIFFHGNQPVKRTLSLEERVEFLEQQYNILVDYIEKQDNSK